MYSALTALRYTLSRAMRNSQRSKMESFRKLKAPFMIAMALIMAAPMLSGAVQYAKSLLG